MKANALTIKGTRENVETVTTFILNELSEIEVSPKVEAQLNVAIDEIYSNISQYAKDGEIIDITVKTLLNGDVFSITFIDGGKPFNPLMMDDPDTSLGLEDRKIGGLGIFIVKNTMDDCKYEYTDNQNMLTITKTIR